MRLHLLPIHFRLDARLINLLTDKHHIYNSSEKSQKKGKENKLESYALFLMISAAKKWCLICGGHLSKTLDLEFGLERL